MQVNKTRGDDEPVGIDDFLSEARRLAANLGDFAVFDPDVGLTTWGTCTVDHRPAFNMKIEICHCEISSFLTPFCFPSWCYPYFYRLWVRQKASRRARRLSRCLENDANLA
jgi:hypothetical protein